MSARAAPAPRQRPRARGWSGSSGRDSAVRASAGRGGEAPEGSPPRAATRRAVSVRAGAVRPGCRQSPDAWCLLLTPRRDATRTVTALVTMYRVSQIIKIHREVTRWFLHPAAARRGPRADTRRGRTPPEPLRAAAPTGLCAGPGTARGSPAPHAPPARSLPGSGTPGTDGPEPPLP